MEGPFAKKKKNQKVAQFRKERILVLQPNERRQRISDCIPNLLHESMKPQKKEKNKRCSRSNLMLEKN